MDKLKTRLSDRIKELKNFDLDHDEQISEYHNVMSMTEYESDKVLIEELENVLKIIKEI